MRDVVLEIRNTSAFGLGLDNAVILMTTIFLILTGARLYPRLAT